MKRKNATISWDAAAAAALAVILAAGLLAAPSAAAEGVRSGLTACSSVLIPSLFPFMALAGFITCGPAGRILARPLAPLTRRLFRLDPSLGPLVLMSFIGGYPVGAKAIAGLLERGELDRQTAFYLLTFCICPGPSFVVSAVGLAVFGSAKAGGILFVCQLLAALLLGWAQARRRPAPARAGSLCGREAPASVALVEGVAGAVTGMLNICGFVLVFSTVIALLKSTGLFECLGNTAAAAAAGLLEVTYGILSCSSLPHTTACLLVPFLLSFGSVSVCCQVMACLRGHALPFGRLLAARVLHGLTTTALAAPALLYVGPVRAAEAWMGPTAVISGNWAASALSAAGLLGMCSLLLLSLGREER